jgi:hypothetical protein
MVGNVKETVRIGGAGVHKMHRSTYESSIPRRVSLPDRSSQLRRGGTIAVEGHESRISVVLFIAFGEGDSIDLTSQSGMFTSLFYTRHVASLSSAEGLRSQQFALLSCHVYHYGTPFAMKHEGQTGFSCETRHPSIQCRTVPRSLQKVANRHLQGGNR